MSEENWKEIQVRRLCDHNLYAVSQSNGLLEVIESASQQEGEN